MLGRPLEEVELFYDGLAAEPNYDINTTLSKITKPLYASYKLSAEKVNANYQLRQGKINYKLIFICLISLTALILGFILFKNFGKLNEFTDD